MRLVDSMVVHALACFAAANIAALQHAMSSRVDSTPQAGIRFSIVLGSTSPPARLVIDQASAHQIHSVPCISNALYLLGREVRGG